MTTTNTTTDSAEQAVRDYIEYLQDPASAVDEEQIAALSKELSECTDVLQRVHLYAALFSAQHPDVTELEDAFIQAAPIYADTNNLVNPVGSFAAVKVPRAVLKRAFPNEVKTNSTGLRVTQEDVYNAIPDGTFTVNQLVEATGASRGTVVKAFENMAEEVGPDPDHKGKGQAPTLYKRAT